MSDFSRLMLTTARESRKMSQSALSRASGVSQASISKIEAGIVVDPSAAVVAKLALALNYRVSLFSVSMRFQHLPITFFRKRQIGVNDVKRIRGRVNLIRLRIEELMKSWDYDGPQLALADLNRDGLSPAEAAQRLRVFWNVPPGPIKNLTAMVESFGIMVVPVDFGTNAVDGLSLYDTSNELPPLIFMNRDVPADRWRLTLAHELGHIVMHHRLDLPPSHRELEEEAFGFGAEFLAPWREIGGHLTRVDMARLAALKRHWGVSMASLAMRAQKSGRVRESEAKWLWIQLGRQGKNEPVEIAREEPGLLAAVVDKHLNELGYSVEDLSSVLHMSPDEFRAEFGIHSPTLRLA